MMRRIATLLIAMLGVAAPLLAGGPAAAREALLMDGKTSLQQRVLTRPGAEIRKAPEAGAPLVEAAVPPFSVFYVYGRKGDGDAAWVEVGTARQGEPKGWMPARLTVPWKHMLTLVFAPRATRQRALFFGNPDDLQNLIESEVATEEAKRIYEQIEHRQVQPMVTAIEPASVPSFQDRFYLLPIFDFIDAEFDVGERTRLLRVASVTTDPEGPPAIDDERARSKMARGEGTYNPDLKSLKTAVVFVVDTTRSMGPYIDRTRKTVEDVYRTIEQKGLLDKVAFGLIGYRDSLKGRPELGYTTKVFADLDADRPPAELLERLKQMTPATASSEGFEEDPYAGIKAAVDQLDWSGFGKRFIILITDAGARGPSDPLAATGLDAQQVRQLAASKGIAIYPFHLLTPEGQHDHTAAAAAYTELSRQADTKVGSLYQGVRAGSVAEFGRSMDTLAGTLTEEVARTAQGTVAPEPEAPKDPSDDQARLKYQARAVSRAMELDYLGGEAPQFYYAWVADRDLVSPSVPSVEVRVLLTRNQLSALAQALSTIVRTAEDTSLTPDDFFNQLRSAVATLTRDPALLGKAGFTNLMDTGLFGEFLDDLPYRSKLLTIDQDLWSRWSVGEQQEFLDELDAKLRLYRAYYETTENWHDLGAGDPAEEVFPVPLEALP